ncbi:hypothetical protein DFR42_10683 [Undibacterium pigrum]|uniref:Uncharacterized protein n=1 Tax=Undibacterium pigrum TaxID=401470 RepID=A0A318J464_9BURK|nr:hypothetical protein DFR42_10683 [Undibacterium pigrum]
MTACSAKCSTQVASFYRAAHHIPFFTLVYSASYLHHPCFCHHSPIPRCRQTDSPGVHRFFQYGKTYVLDLAACRGNSMVLIGDKDTITSMELVQKVLAAYYRFVKTLK